MRGWWKFSSSSSVWGWFELKRALIQRPTQLVKSIDELKIRLGKTNLSLEGRIFNSLKRILKVF